MADYLSQFTGSEIDTRLSKVSQLETGKQDKLVSGTNIKTINGSSVLGGGDLSIQTGDPNAVLFTSQTLTDAQKEQARANIDAASLEDVTALNDAEFVVAWDGTSTPVVANIPAGVTVTYNTTTYTGTLAASASTAGNIYLVKNSSNYDMYVSTASGSSYSWVGIGSTALDLSGYATTAQVSQLEHKVDSLPRGKNYGFFTSSSLLPSGATEEGFAYVGATEPYAIWQFDGTTWTDSGVTANAFSADPEDVQESVDEYLQDHPTVSGTFLNVAKHKLISLLEKVAFIDEHGQHYIDELTAWLFLAPIDHISAVYTQGNTKIYDIYSLDKLKNNLVVTAYFTDGSSSVVTDYTLTGNLVVGTSTITVSVYDIIAQVDVTGTFNVSVIGTTKLYMDGDECSSLTGGWQVKGFYLTGGSPSATKESSYLFIKFAASATSGGAARTFSTVNKIPLTGLTKVIVESEAWNESGRCNDTLYFTASVNESTTQAGAFGNDSADHRVWIVSVPQDTTHFTGFKKATIPGSLSEAYVSINANAFTNNGTYFSAGTYWKIKKVALAAE